MTQVIHDIKKLYEERKSILENAFKEFDTKIEPSKDHFEQVRNKTNPRFGLTYTLDAALKAVEVCISETPSRELSIIKTKIQEAIHWIDEIK